MARLRQIKASAGSGKTYTLTEAYIEALLGSAEEHSRAVCAAPGVLAPHSCNEILAITFTNAAAAEMRARVLARLKTTALNADEFSAQEREAAEKWLNVFLRDMSSLNIRTIDSLLHMIVRASVLELGLNPAFEPVFESAEVVRPYAEKFLAQAESNPALRTLVEDAVGVFAMQEHGFGAYAKFIKSLLGAFEGSILHKYDEASPLAEIRQARAALEPELVQANESKDRIRKSEALANAELVAAASSFIAACTPEQVEGMLAAERKKLEDIAGGKLPRKQPAPLESGVMGAIFKKSYKGDFVGLEESFERLCSAACAKYQRTAEEEAEIASLATRDATLSESVKLLDKALAVVPFIQLAREVARSFQADMAALDKLPSALIPGLASAALEPDGGVADTLCRIGSRLTDFLVDEFQDTSREQWGVLRELVVEALSRGGSLTWVGDVKQSIYGWRNGDPSLFDEVGRDGALLALAQAPVATSLPTNWRSRPEIVRFNNEVFGRLSDPDLCSTLVENALGKKIDPGQLSTVVAPIVAAYAGAAQQTPAASAESEPGFVQGFPGAAWPDEETEEQKPLEQLLLNIHQRRPWSDILVLIRSNDHILDIAGGLIASGIPVITENSLVLATDPVVAQLVSALEFLEAPENDLAFAEVILGSVFIEAARSLSPDSLTDWIARVNLSSSGTPLYQHFARDYPDIYDRIFGPFVKGASLMGPYDVVMEWCSHLRVEQRNRASLPFIRRFMEVAQLAEEAGHTSLSSFLEYWREHGKEEKAPLPAGMDAIRLMTIHKAKGLQAPVCIVPFTDFAIIPSSDHTLAPYGRLRIPISLQSRLAGTAYFQDLAKQTLENLNMLYVAFTRAEEELHFFVQRRKDGRFARVTGILEGLIEAAGWELPLRLGRVNEAGHTQGQEATTVEETQALPNVEDDPPDWRPMHWLSSLKIFRNRRGGESKFSPEERGIFLHYCLEKLQLAGDPAEDAGRALAYGLRHSGLRVPDGELDSLRSALRWFAALPDAARWRHFGWPEHPLIDGKGFARRTDLLVPEPDGALVIDYKSGIPRDEDIEQVREYMRCVAESGEFGPNVRGLLLYLVAGKARHIDFEAVSDLLPQPQARA